MATATTKKTVHENLVQALAAFQADLPSIGLDADNPHFKSKFASLSNVSKEVLPLLAKQGLAFSVGTFVEEGKLILDAHLLHESGTSRSAQFPIVETNPQKVGSAVTYYRRYALGALTGVVADLDDDGNAASVPTQAARNLDKARTQKVENQSAANADKTLSPAASTLKKKIGALVASKKTTPDRANALVKEKAKELSADENSAEVFSAVLAALEAEIESA